MTTAVDKMSLNDVGFIHTQSLSHTTH